MPRRSGALEMPHNVSVRVENADGRDINRKQFLLPARFAQQS
jgi:hypothetical protein